MDNNISSMANLNLLDSSTSVENSTRHCANCLKVCELPVKKCSRCQKRAYCSKACQVADWSSGQCHKNWCCKFEYGEEDIDWEVVPVPNKGLGVVAKRFFPAGSRIIVEPVFTNPNGHPGIKDLEPKGGSLEAKFELNSFQGDDYEDGEDRLGLRTARVNHSCQPNAGIGYDEVARVRVLLAQKDIQAGEEICIIYSELANLEKSFQLDVSPREIPKYHTAVRQKYGITDADHPDELEFGMIQWSLEYSWGIKCPPDCFCKNLRVKKLVMEGRRCSKEMLKLGSKGRIEDALKAGDRLLEIEKELNFSWNQRAIINWDMYEMTIASEKMDDARAKKYLQNYLEINKIMAPYSKFTEPCELLLKNGVKAPNQSWKKQGLKKVMQKCASRLQ